MLNPESGREAQVSITRVSETKKVVVVGGGPGGLKAASVAARRGHDVALYEGNEVLGGQFRLASIPPHKEVFQEGLDCLIREAEQSGASIVNGFSVDETNVDSLDANVVVLARGGADHS